MLGSEPAEKRVSSNQLSPSRSNLCRLNRYLLNLTRWNQTR